MFSLFLRVVGAIQLLLGLCYLFMPANFLQQMGHSAAAPDLYYPLAMLAARFIAYGIGFMLISRNAREHALWVLLMVLIQLIDLAAGVFYTISGIVPLQLSAFPMFNALWIGVCCAVWYRRNAA
ncbi:hypothetical protein [Duganella qianjiadongensis]|uniref:DUF4345 domain-containing protein n=1 Tax=Duganella qianjiadongensis TaxID=2692176 RepID=A0ABW9VSE2_9BURK|nr:hypothetical protein [Duganella qianjiadongensis]MYM42112.1 hypothetical protein [Duganella qianjiadongensis]